MFITVFHDKWARIARHTEDRARAHTVLDFPQSLTLAATPPPSQCRLFGEAGVTRWAPKRSETDKSRPKSKDPSWRAFSTLCYDGRYSIPFKFSRSARPIIRGDLRGSSAPVYTQRCTLDSDLEQRIIRRGREIAEAPSRAKKKSAKRRSAVRRIRRCAAIANSNLH